MVVEAQVGRSGQDAVLRHQRRERSHRPAADAAHDAAAVFAIGCGFGSGRASVVHRTGRRRRGVHSAARGRRRFVTSLSRRGRALRRGGSALLDAVRATAVLRNQRGQRRRFENQPRRHQVFQPPPQGEHSGSAGCRRAAHEPPPARRVQTSCQFQRSVQSSTTLRRRKRRTRPDGRAMDNRPRNPRLESSTAKSAFQ
jgi:hypothetical protein